MLLGNSDFIMRQEQYHDLRREADQERLIRAAGLWQPTRWKLSWNLSRIIRSNSGKTPPPAQLKKAAL